MLRSESEIRTAMIETLKAQIEAVETDDEAQYIVNNAKQTVYAYVLQLNVYGRDFNKKRGAAMRLIDADNFVQYLGFDNTDEEREENV